MMTMDQLFDKLPRDLQLEVLSEFVGTHAVRNGQLRRKIDFTTLNVVNPMRVRAGSNWLFKSKDDTRTRYIRLSTLTPASRKMVFWEDPYTGDTICLTRTMERDQFIPVWRVDFAPTIEDTIVHEPFEKHVYPSYPYTNKKNANRV